MKRLSNLTIIIALLAINISIFPARVTADNYWICDPCFVGDFSDPANWDYDLLVGDNCIISNGGKAELNIYSADLPSMNNFSLRSGSLEHSAKEISAYGILVNGTYELRETGISGSDHLIVGYPQDYQGLFIQHGGIVNTNNIRVGVMGGIGSYFLDSGKLNVTGSLYLGYGSPCGEGTFNQSGGKADIHEFIVRKGGINISGGELKCDKFLNMGTFNWTGGTIHAKEIRGFENFENIGGTLSPGDANTMTAVGLPEFGHTDIFGNYIQHELGTLAIGIGTENNMLAYDSLWTQGRAELNGFIYLNLYNSEHLSVGTEFSIVTSDTSVLDNGFAMASPVLNDGAMLQAQIEDNALKLKVVQGVPLSDADTGDSAYVDDDYTVPEGTQTVDQATVTPGANLDLPQGSELTVDNGLNIEQGASMNGSGGTINGDITNSGDVSGSGGVHNGNMDNSGTITSTDAINNGNLNNSGTVNSTGGERNGDVYNTGEINFTGGEMNGNWENYGTIHAGGGGSFNGTIINHGQIISDGSGSSGGSGGNNFVNIINYGDIVGSGDSDVFGSFENHGTFDPGQGVNDSVFTGSYIQSGELILQIGGYEKGTDYDFLGIEGSAIIEGIIDITLINGFIPNAGDTFDIMTAELGIQIGLVGLQLQGSDMFTFVLSEDGKTLSLQTVPEPASFLFLIMGLLALRKKINN